MRLHKNRMQMMQQRKILLSICCVCMMRRMISILEMMMNMVVRGERLNKCKIFVFELILPFRLSGFSSDTRIQFGDHKTESVLNCVSTLYKLITFYQPSKKNINCDPKSMRRPYSLLHGTTQ